MLTVFLSINNNEEVIELPVVPFEPDVGSPFDNDTFDGMVQELNLIGLRGLKSYTINSYFPINDYPYLRNREMWGMEYVEIIERWRDQRIPVRYIVRSDKAEGFNINDAVVIADFNYYPDRAGDIRYTLEMLQFPFVQVVT